MRLRGGSLIGSVWHYQSLTVRAATVSRIWRQLCRRFIGCPWRRTASTYPQLPHLCSQPDLTAEVKLHTSLLYEFFSDHWNQPAPAGLRDQVATPWHVPQSRCLNRRLTFQKLAFNSRKVCGHQSCSLASLRVNPRLDGAMSYKTPSYGTSEGPGSGVSVHASMMQDAFLSVSPKCVIAAHRYALQWQSQGTEG